MPAVTFSRRHYRFIFKLFVFIVLCGLVVVLVFRKGDGLSNDIEAKAAWIKDSVFNISFCFLSTVILDFRNS